MPLLIATWNVNSARLRAPHIQRFLERERPDVLCLQETKCPPERFPREPFEALGYRWIVVEGGQGRQGGYNGVAILSRLPVEPLPARDFAALGQPRHAAVRLPGGVELHDFYVPAGGDVPDPEANPKFAQKLAYLDDLTRWAADRPPARTILVGDLNIAPREDDVWNHRALLDVVSHTPVEVERLARLQEAGEFRDITRQDIPQGRLYSWWSYRARDWAASDRGRRLDHIWATPDLAAGAGDSRILREMRDWERPSDHVPVLASFDIG